MNNSFVRPSRFGVALGYHPVLVALRSMIGAVQDVPVYVLLRKPYGGTIPQLAPLIFTHC